MEKNFKRKINVMALILIIINFIITFISPRFGYAFHGVDRHGQDDAFIYKTTQNGDVGRKDIYENSSGIFMSLEYSSRFLGERYWVYDGQPPEIGTTMIDGGIKNATHTNEDTNAAVSRYDTIRYDSGGFFFLPYILPCLLIVLSRRFIGKDRYILNIFSVVLITLSILISTRMTTFLTVWIP